MGVPGAGLTGPTTQPGATARPLRRILPTLAIAGLVALLAALGGNWGEALGQTAGPPLERQRGGSGVVVPQPVITPPPATEYRPAPDTAGAARGAASPPASTLPRDTSPAAGPSDPQPTSITTPAVQPPLLSGPMSTTTRPSESAPATPAQRAAVGGAPDTASPSSREGSNSLPVTPLQVALVGGGGLAAVGAALWWRRRLGG